VTFVPGPLVRSVGPDSFRDIIGPNVLARPDGDGLTFDADLTDAQVCEIRERMTSRDDNDQAERAVQRGRAEKAEEWVDDNAAAEAQVVWLTQAFADLARYVLGEA